MHLWPAVSPSLAGSNHTKGLVHQTSRTELTPWGIRISYSLHLLHSCQTTRVFVTVSFDALLFTEYCYTIAKKHLWSVSSSPHYMHASLGCHPGCVAWRLGIREDLMWWRETHLWFAREQLEPSGTYFVCRLVLICSGQNLRYGNAQSQMVLVSQYNWRIVVILSHQWIPLARTCSSEKHAHISMEW